MTDAPDLTAIEATLRARKRELDERIGGFAKAPERGAQLSFGKRVGDGTTEAISRITEVGVGTSLEVSAARVTRALEKIGDGTYGVCDSCAKPIGSARLQAFPESVLCVDCAGRA